MICNQWVQAVDTMKQKYIHVQILLRIQIFNTSTSFRKSDSSPGWHFVNGLAMPPVHLLFIHLFVLPHNGFWMITFVVYLLYLCTTDLLIITQERPY